MQIDLIKIKNILLILILRTFTRFLGFISTQNISAVSNNMSKCVVEESLARSFFTSLGSADLSELRGSFRLRRGEKGACVLHPAAKGHLADLAVRAVAVHFALVVWQHLRHCGNRGKKGNRTEKIRFFLRFGGFSCSALLVWSWIEMRKVQAVRRQAGRQVSERSRPMWTVKMQRDALACAAG